jgi:hypothetical protein
MKRSTIIGMLAVVLVGCVPTLNPVYTQRDLIYDAALLGFWRQRESTATWNFTKAGEKEYALAYTDTEGRSGTFTARLANVGGVQFLDLYPVKDELESSEFYKFHLLPIHTVYIVRQTSPDLKLAGFDLKWLDEYLQQNPDALQHSTYNGQQLVTASTEELQAFLLEHQGHFNVDFELAKDAF